MGRYVFHAPLRWSDLDAFGHVNNSRVLTLYEEARVALFFTDASRQGVTTFADGIVIARHEVDYLRPIDFGDPVRIEMWVEEIRPSRAVVAYELFAGEHIASRARSVCVAYDLREQRSRRLTEAEQAFLKRWLIQ